MKNEKYPHILHIDHGIAEDINNKASSTVGTGVIDLEGILVP